MNLSLVELRELAASDRYQSEIDKAHGRENGDKVRALRKSLIMSGKVCDRLGCTYAELNRLDKAGALPHAKKQRKRLPSKMQEVRLWFVQDVETFEGAQ